MGLEARHDLAGLVLPDVDVLDEELGRVRVHGRVGDQAHADVLLVHVGTPPPPR